MTEQEVRANFEWWSETEYLNLAITSIEYDNGFWYVNAMDENNTHWQVESKDGIDFVIW